MSRSGWRSPTAPTWSACWPGWRGRRRRSISAPRSCRYPLGRPPRRRWPGRRSTNSPAGASSSASGRPARRSPKAGTGCPTRSPGAGPASTSKWCGRSSPARGRWSTTATHYDLPLPGGEGKALKLNFHPLRNEIPVFVGAIGRKSVQMAAEDLRRLDPDLLLRRRLRGDLGRAPRGRLRQERADARRPGGLALAAGARSTATWRRPGTWSRPGLVLYLGGMGVAEDQLLRRSGPPLRLRRRRRRGPAALPGRRPRRRLRGDAGRDRRRRPPWSGPRPKSPSGSSASPPPGRPPDRLTRPM